MAESKEELKNLFMKRKEESEKAGLKLNVQKTKIMAFDPITSWQIDGEKMETVTDFIFLAPKSLWTVTAAMKLKDVCSLEENLDSILKSRGQRAQLRGWKSEQRSSEPHVRLGDATTEISGLEFLLTSQAPRTS